MDKRKENGLPHDADAPEVAARVAALKELAPAALAEVKSRCI